MSAFVNSIGEKETMEVEIAFALQLLRFCAQCQFFRFLIPTLISLILIHWLLRLFDIKNSKHIWWKSQKVSFIFCANLLQISIIYVWSLKKGNLQEFSPWIIYVWTFKKGNLQDFCSLFIKFIPCFIVQKTLTENLRHLTIA